MPDIAADFSYQTYEENMAPYSPMNFNRLMLCTSDSSESDEGEMDFMNQQMKETIIDQRTLGFGAFQNPYGHQANLVDSQSSDSDEDQFDRLFESDYGLEQIDGLYSQP